MLLGCGYLHKFGMLYFLLFCFSKKQKIIGLKKNSWPKFCNIIFLFLFKINSLGTVDQQINLILPNSFFARYVYFNDLVIKNDSVKKAKSFFIFMEGIQLHYNQVLVLEDRTFHGKVLNRQQK